MNTAREPEAVIDAALDAYPLPALPAGFTARTMARIRADRRQSPRARGATRPWLGFLDLALPAFAVVFAAAVLGTAGLIGALGDPLWVVAWTLDARLTCLTWQARGPVLPAVGVILSAGLALTAAVGCGAWWLSDRPLRSPDAIGVEADAPGARAGI